MLGAIRWLLISAAVLLAVELARPPVEAWVGRTTLERVAPLAVIAIVAFWLVLLSRAVVRGLREIAADKAAGDWRRRATGGRD